MNSDLRRRVENYVRANYPPERQERLLLALATMPDIQTADAEDRHAPLPTNR